MLGRVSENVNGETYDQCFGRGRSPSARVQAICILRPSPMFRTELQNVSRGTTTTNKRPYYDELYDLELDATKYREWKLLR
jgi:hypothetical protein